METSIGALPDLRSETEKEKNYQHSEIASAAPFEWKEHAESDWPKYPVFDQGQDGTCVAQTTAKELGINNFKEEGLFAELSRADIYSRRSNKPGQGMNGPEANDFTVKHGITMESLIPTGTAVSSNDKVKRTPTTESIGKIFSPSHWLVLPYDIDEIAKVLNSGIPAKIFLKWNVNEWDRDIPELNPNESNYNGSHSTCFTFATLFNGKKYLVTEDSWGKNKGKEGRRLVSEEWINPKYGRIFFASYFIDKKNLFSGNEISKPKYSWSRDLTIGDRGEDVLTLQIALSTVKYNDVFLFPTKQPPTGYFGGLTRQAVKDYQKLRSIPDTGYFGPMTRKVANEEFG